MFVINRPASILNCIHSTHSGHVLQIWASSFMPNSARTKDRTQREYYEKHGSPMLVDYTKKELVNKVRLARIYYMTNSYSIYIMLGLYALMQKNGHLSVGIRREYVEKLRSHYNTRVVGFSGKLSGLCT